MLSICWFICFWTSHFFTSHLSQGYIVGSRSLPTLSSNSADLDLIEYDDDDGELYVSDTESEGSGFSSDDEGGKGTKAEKNRQTQLFLHEEKEANFFFNEEQNDESELAAEISADLNFSPASLTATGVDVSSDGSAAVLRVPTQMQKDSPCRPCRQEDHSHRGQKASGRQENHAEEVHSIDEEVGKSLQDERRCGDATQDYHVILERPNVRISSILFYFFSFMLLFYFPFLSFFSVYL